MNSNKGCFLEHNHSIEKANLEQNASENFDYVFTLIPKSTPNIVRKCARCDGDRFASSDKFRVNANKKIIDVWLVFKCVSCDYTLNISILSRKPVASIDRALLEGFHNNDVELAWKYAFDPSLLERDANVDWKIDFEVDQENSDPQSKILFSLNSNSEGEHCEKITLLITSCFFLKIPIYKVLRKILNVSRSYLEKMQTKGIEITTFQGKSVTLKNSIGFGCRLRL